MNPNDLPHYQNNDELPLTLHARDIAGYLGISLSAAYQLINAKDFPVKKLGKRRFISKAHFLDWVQNTTGEIV